MKVCKILLLTLCICGKIFAQDDSTVETAGDIATSRTVNQKLKTHMYHINNAVDMPIVGLLGGTSIYLISAVIYTKSMTPTATIISLNKNDVPSFDRHTAGWYNSNLNTISYYPFYAVMPLPLLLLADKRIASDKGRIGLMYLEAFAFEGILYTSSVYFAPRFRPEAYDTNLSLSTRTNGNLRNSFFAGHVAVTALSTFFVSKVYNDYHPHSKIRWVLYGASAAMTLGMAYMRLYSGQHFASDIAVGMVVGTACGLGVPMVHKNKDYKKQKWSLSPDLFNGGNGIAGGFSFTYKL